ncbi:hypothetical protein SIID45300_03068 [Candidatus Magnetaquicoccaceae bacterium FCR-1]|uniref:GmrSD restriction endonucleases N-terminal domain-containing protein n=1 Tax=Candidatus Magnetaquiglobus chichijimensis TaxID=3141448 RepID=A0ABQ0CCT2_9PROT
MSHFESDESLEAEDMLDSGVEPEEIGINKPFDPTKINVQTKQMSLDTLVKRINENEIDLSPDFQRNEVWKKPAKCRLIESLLIRIPLPAFYMDATDEGHWLVVDGLQRLSTLRDFILHKSLDLSDLEFLKDVEGKRFNELPRNYQRRIEETQVTVYLIEKGTPPDVKFNIFKRINTGGMPLSAQEIRHALHQGPATERIKVLAESQAFLKATANGMKNQRMADRECVLRFLAFSLTPYPKYPDDDFDAFLSNAMSRLNTMAPAQLNVLEMRFKRAMELATRIFGNRAFRKESRNTSARSQINKALFEAWSINLASLDDEAQERIVDRKTILRNKFLDLMDNDTFFNAVTQGTGSWQRVQKRFQAIHDIIQATLEEPQP